MRVLAVFSPPLECQVQYQQHYRRDAGNRVRRRRSSVVHGSRSFACNSTPDWGPTYRQNIPRLKIVWKNIYFYYTNLNSKLGDFSEGMETVKSFPLYDLNSFMLTSDFYSLPSHSFVSHVFHRTT